MAIDLISAIQISDAPSEDDFLAIQNAVTNTNHFSASSPRNYLSSWEGYWNKFNVSLSTNSVGAGGGVVTVTYTTSSSLKSGITPTVSSNVGGSYNVSPSATNASGQGTCKFMIPSRGTDEGPARTVTITVSYGNCKGTATLTQVANTLLSEKKMDLYYWSQSRYSIPAFADNYGDPDITYQVYQEYRFSSGAYVQSGPGVGLTLELTYESKDKWGIGDINRMWIRQDTGTDGSGYGNIYLGFSDNYSDSVYTHYLNGRYPNGSNIMRSEWTQGTTNDSSGGGGDSSW